MWTPTDKEQKYIELVISMSTDCLLGKGVANNNTYCQNLLMIAEQLFKIAPGHQAGVGIGDSHGNAKKDAKNKG